MNSTEEKILSAAQSLFFRFGFKKTSVDEIAAEAGVGKGTIYNYFANKEELFLNLCSSTHCGVKEKVEQDIEHITEADKRIFERGERELKIFSEQKKEFAVTPALMEELFDVIATIEGAEDSHKQGLYKDLELGVKQGIFKEINIDEVANSIFNVMRQSTVKWLFMDFEEVKKERNSILTLMIDGIRKN